jgi:tRNA dimethylallyltransferase
MSTSTKNISKKRTYVPCLIVVCGSTATGKSDLAIALAKRLNSVILSADSRQVYREFNIGTAKPSLEDQKAIPHYLIDLCDPTETLTLAEYQQQAQQLIYQFHANTLQAESPIPCPLLVGGTGLYLRAITQGLVIPPVPPQTELRSQLQTLGQSQCYAMLQQVDPRSASKICANDQTRTLRSLEVFYTTGQPMSQLQGQNPPSYPILQIGLDCQTTEDLRSRIARRTAHMLDLGFIHEVVSLCAKYGNDLALLNTLGYAEFKQHILGNLSQSEAERLTILHTRQFAKRQRTWFRGVADIKWFDANAIDLLEQVWDSVQIFLDLL